MGSELLIVFIKNAFLGRVKTRLAKNIGKKNALKVYYHLLNHTRGVTAELNCDITIFYSDKIVKNDLWKETIYNKEVQRGNDLGEKMAHAFEHAFKKGYEKVVVIGSDNLEITPSLINEAFKKLNSSDLVIGPASDGGYYLIGMKSHTPVLFYNIPWSTSMVLEKTMQIIKRLKLKLTLQKTLNDIDNFEDYQKAVRSGIIKNLATN